jgi:long-subunit acyl-CoA synthetase (AMP-forming)
MFLPSPRNSLEGQVNLFKKTSCNVLITTPINKVQVYIDQYLMRLIYVPDLEDLLAPGEIPRYKYLKSFDEAKDDPLVVLHTSGSTGLPKPVLLTQSWVCGLDRLQNLGKHDGCGVLLLNFVGKRIFSCLPAFHVSC